MFNIFWIMVLGLGQGPGPRGRLPLVISIIIGSSRKVECLVTRLFQVVRYYFIQNRLEKLVPTIQNSKWGFYFAKREQPHTFQNLTFSRYLKMSFLEVISWTQVWVNWKRLIIDSWFLILDSKTLKKWTHSNIDLVLFLCLFSLFTLHSCLLSLVSKIKKLCS